MPLERTIKIKIDSSGAKRNVNSLDRSMKGLGSTADNTNQSFGKLKTTVIAVAAALQVRVVIAYSDAWKRTTNVLASSVTETQSLVQAQKDVIQISNDARAPLEQTAKLYAGISASAEELNASQEDIAKFTELAAKSLAVAGSSAQESAGALLQLKQAIGGTVIQAQEFNSLIDGARPLLEAVAKGSDRFGGSVNKLREQVKLGTVTSKEFFEAALKGSDLIDKRFNKTLATFEANMILADNAATEFVGTSDLITSSVGAAGESIVFLAENLDTLGNVLIVAAIVGISKLSSVLIINTLETVRSTVAKTANIKATSVIVDVTGKQIITTTRLTVAQRAATLTATGLSRAMAFLGGPLGVVLLAASAIAIFSTSTDDATEKLKEFNKEAIKSGFLSVKLTSEDLDKSLTKQQGLDKVNLAIKLTERNLRRANKTLIATQKNFDRGAAPLNFVEQSKIQVSELEQKLKDLRGQLSQIQGGALDKPKTDKGVKQDDRESAFLSSEQLKTDGLRAQLNERLAIQRSFNNIMLSEFSTIFEQERAASKFNEEASLAELDTKRTNSALEFEERLERLKAQEIKEKTDLSVIRGELGLQQLDQSRIFELERTDIEREGAEERKLITLDEAEFKAEAQARSAEIAVQANRSSQDMILGFLSQFAGKSKGIAITLVALRAAQAASEIIIDTQRGSMLAVAQLGIFAAPAVAAIQTQGAIALGIVGANAALKLGSIGSGGGGSGGGGLSSTGAGEQTPAARQEPIQQQNTVEFRGLSEVVELLANLDPDEVLPVEYTQRIVASLDEYSRISGGSD